ncbi:MAG: dockerin type I domain-containing protein [Planctomycetota bacterium]|nr:dockerin type I domain-containing protein [Planctomycetota bacterium]
MNYSHRNSSSRRRKQSRPLRLEQLETRRVLTSIPYGATEFDLGEFLLGDVAVTPVFLESNGQLDPSTEDWNSLKIQSVLNDIDVGMQWWENTLANQNSVHSLNFTIDTAFATTPVDTQYEGINRRSNDYTLYVQEFLSSQGYNGFSLEANMRAFNHAQREKHDANWAFTIMVVPSFNDADGQFPPNGSFRRAFAFAGGLFMVVPSTRPASTYSHELGHIFWARDEYPGGGNYLQRRGYYNTQNLNAHDNPEPGFQQQPSIMAAGSLLTTAFAQNTSAPSTLAQLGWQDSDGDGIFDVLDVPHSLTGTGYLDTTTSRYRFIGQAKVQTLPNINSFGNRNDITLNRIREIEYRFDQGPWQIHSQPDAYEADLDLSIPVPDGAQEIEIRARDSQTTVVSNVFQGRMGRADATQVAGINGFAWIDQNQNGLRDIGEDGQAFWDVQLVDAAGDIIDSRKTIEPDDYANGQLTSGQLAGVTIRSLGIDTDGRVGVFPDAQASTGDKIFHVYSSGARSYLSNWNSSSRRLQVDFSNPTSEVSIDVIGASSTSIGRIEAYNTAGQLVARDTTTFLGSGQVETLTVSRASSDIAYVIVAGHMQTSIKLDFLRYGPQAQMTTGSHGEFAFPNLSPGEYTVQVNPVGSFLPFDPVNGRQTVTVSPNTAISDADFGFRPTTSEWQNPNNENDVNDDSHVTPIDVLTIINDLNTNGARLLTEFVPPPFIDTNGDSFVSPIDALAVINFLNNEANGSGEFFAMPLFAAFELPEELRESPGLSHYDFDQFFEEFGQGGEGEAGSQPLTIEPTRESNLAFWNHAPQASNTASKADKNEGVLAEPTGSPQLGGLA